MAENNIKHEKSFGAYVSNIFHNQKAFSGQSEATMTMTATTTDAVNAMTFVAATSIVPLMQAIDRVQSVAHSHGSWSANVAASNSNRCYIAKLPASS